MEGEKVKKRYDRVAPIYDGLEWLLEVGKFSTWREELFERVRGDTSGGRMLEVGVGTGKNIAYYPKGWDLHAVDFSEKMLEKAEERALEVAKDVDLSWMDIEDLGYEDDSFEAIISTWVFCSVPDPVKGLKELRRVGKPSGRIYMLEHMRSKMIVVRNLMDHFNWIRLNILGENINRKTLRNIEKADLQVIEENDLWLDIFKELVLLP
ncbi:MAG: class I SAM-dependent methyltransferase [Candidatus Thermoplasmatota archaeon]